MKKGVVTQITWEHLKEVILKGEIKKTVPKIEITDLRNLNSSLIELGLGDNVEVHVYPNLYCTFRKNNKPCLNIIDKPKDKMPICNTCRLIIPSIKCIMGEPQCTEKEAPKTLKCIKSGIYENYCKVPRYHYLLIYPTGLKGIYLKVGIQRETTFPTRILEQGALISVIYAKTPNIWRGRYVEVESRNFLEKYENKSIRGFLVQHVSEKKKTLIRVEDLINFIRGRSITLEIFLSTTSTESILDKALELGKIIGDELASHFKEYAISPIVINNLQVYEIDKKLISKAKSVSELNLTLSEMKINGKVAGWLGSFLLLSKNDKILIVNMRALLGRLVLINLS